MKILVQIIESPRTRWRVAPTVFAEHVRRLASALAAEFSSGPRPIVDAIVEEGETVPAGEIAVHYTDGKQVYCRSTMTPAELATRRQEGFTKGQPLYWESVQ